MSFVYEPFMLEKKWIQNNQDTLEDIYDYYCSIENYPMSFSDFNRYLWICEQKNVCFLKPRTQISTSEEATTYLYFSHIYYQLEKYMHENYLPFLSSWQSKNIFIEYNSQMVIVQEKEDIIYHADEETVSDEDIFNYSNKNYEE